MEIERVQNECSLVDIDFEFVIDSSQSIGSANWQTTMDYIAQYWIQGKSSLLEFLKTGKETLLSILLNCGTHKRCDTTKWFS